MTRPLDTLFIIKSTLNNNLSLLPSPGRSGHNKNGRMFCQRFPLLCHVFAAIAGATLGIAGICSVAHAQMKEVTFIVVNNLFSTPAFVAVENGYWGKLGLNVKIKADSEW